MKSLKHVLFRRIYGILLTAFAFSAHAVVLEPPNTFTPQSESSAPQLTDRLIVKYKSNAVQAQMQSVPTDVVQQSSIFAGKGMKHLRRMAIGADVMRLNQKVSPEELQKIMLNLASDPNVQWVQQDKLMKTMATPSDPQYNNQWHYYEATGGLNLPAAWDSSTGSGVVVAVIDTGYTTHADLIPNILPGYDMIDDTFVSNDGDGRDSSALDPGNATTFNECGDGEPARKSSWHGTHVAGTVAAVTNNGLGVAGVAYNAKVVPIRALGKCGGFTSDIADSIIWAAGGSVPGVPANQNPAQVINLSLGGGGPCGPITQNAINQAVGLGATVVVSAGNFNVNASNTSPANCSNVITVASVGRSGGKAYYSNFGSVVDVAAPGGDQLTGTSDGVLSTVNSGRNAPAGDSYAYYQGTSMAAPHVAGAAALLYALDSNITPAEVESILESTSRSFPSTCSQCGAGIVDAAAAVAQVGGGTPLPGPGDSVLENGVAKTGLSGATGSEDFYTIDVPANASDLTFQISGGSGDADLYVRFASAPTTGTYDCRPWRSGNNETCSFPSPNVGTYHVMLRGYRSYSGVSLVASYDQVFDLPPGDERDSIFETGISGSRNQWVNYTLDVPAGSSVLNVNISGGSGDADLYVRFGSNPTTSTYDCRPYRNGNSETCSFTNPAAGTWYIRLRGYRAFSGVTLEATSQ